MSRPLLEPLIRRKLVLILLDLDTITSHHVKFKLIFVVHKSPYLSSCGLD